MKDPELVELVSQFAIEGRCLAVEPLKVGHINETYVSRWSTGRRYIHQRLNHQIFKNIPVLMATVAAVTNHVRSKLEAGLGESGEQTLALVPTRNGELFLSHSEQGYWRSFPYIENTDTYEVCPSTDHAFEAARTLGRFVSYLRDLDVSAVCEALPRFQDARFRYEGFDEAVREDRKGRLGTVSAEIDFANSQRLIACTPIDSLTSGRVPMRITHADPKVSNVLFSRATGRGVCVVDLDTCMPGTVLYDFGDLIRSTAVPAAEDERELSKVFISVDFYEALVRGYLQHTASYLTKDEIALLATAPRSLAITLGVRFLTDHLNGDVYFRVKREGHNLDRARAQFQIARSMEREQHRMERAVQDVVSSLRLRRVG